MIPLNTTTIPIIISGVAVTISLVSLIETIKNRKVQGKRNSVQYQLERCNEALGLIMFNNMGMDSGLEAFKQLYACKMVLEKNLLSLKPNQLKPLLEELKTVEDDYAKVSGKKLGCYSRNLKTTQALYDKEDFPQELSSLYWKVHDLSLKRQSELLSKMGK